MSLVAPGVGRRGRWTPPAAGQDAADRGSGPDDLVVRTAPAR